MFVFQFRLNWFHIHYICCFFCLTLNNSQIQSIHIIWCVWLNNQNWNVSFWMNAMCLSIEFIDYCYFCFCFSPNNKYQQQTNIQFAAHHFALLNKRFTNVSSILYLISKYLQWLNTNMDMFNWQYKYLKKHEHIYLYLMEAQHFIAYWHLAMAMWRRMPSWMMLTMDVNVPMENAQKREIAYSWQILEP